MGCSLSCSRFHSDLLSLFGHLCSRKMNYSCHILKLLKKKNPNNSYFMLENFLLASFIHFYRGSNKLRNSFDWLQLMVR